MSPKNQKLPIAIASLVVALGATALRPVPAESVVIAQQKAQQSTMRATSLYLPPTDDVWVYPHAGNPAQDEYLRAWGAGDSAVGTPEDDAAFSYSYLRWDISELPKDTKIARAMLGLMHVADPEFTLTDSKSFPLQIRALSGPFKETDWSYDKVGKVRPDSTDKGKFGDGAAQSMPAGQEFPIVVDLMKGPGDFKTYWVSALQKGELALALTSPINPEDFGQAGVYKVYARNAKNAKLRPVLMLWFEKPAK